MQITSHTPWQLRMKWPQTYTNTTSPAKLVWTLSEYHISATGSALSLGTLDLLQLPTSCGPADATRPALATSVLALATSPPRFQLIADLKATEVHIATTTTTGGCGAPWAAPVRLVHPSPLQNSSLALRWRAVGCSSI
jgi:hypothetical protein